MISSLVLRNFGPFRGEHRLGLTPTTYAVVARREDDPEASNMGGKSWLLSAIRLALYGSHLADREDGWITRGEGEGEINVKLSDGTSILRSREVGKTTQLFVDVPGSGLARGKDAQQLIARRVGLDEEDFLTASFFEQKRMARFITARSSARSLEVSAWLRLHRVEACRARVSSLAVGLENAEREEAAAVRHLSDRIGKLVAPSSEEILRLEADAASRAAQVRAASEELDHANRLFGLARTVEHRAQLRAEIAELEVLGDEEPDVRAAEERHMHASVEYREMRRNAADKRSLAAGEFCGTCPVNGRECPIADQLNANRERNVALAQDADEKLRVAHEWLLMVSAQLESAQRALAALRMRRTRLQALREQLAHIDASTPALEPGDTVPDGLRIRKLTADLGSLRELERAALSALDRARSDVDEAVRLRAELDRRSAELDRIRSELRTHREALAVLGRGGAQRRLAEGALREIQAGACALLSEAGIDLSVAMTWDRPTDQPATSCSRCGASFPPSRAVKACAGCGAARGPKMAEALDVELSKRSGFAEDAAGIALSLAASAWLRRERDVQWPVLCADEPFAAADAKNRRALLNLFRVAGSQCGLRQVFLVAHNDEIMHSLPSAIQVIAGKEGSRVEIIG